MEELVNLKTAPAHDLGVTGAHSDLQYLLFVCNVGVLHNNNNNLSFALLSFKSNTLF